MYSEELFQDFLANRAEMFGKKINTTRAVSSQRKKLDDWGKIGYNLDAILTHAIDVGWRGLYLPQGMTPKQTHLRPSGAVKDLVDRIDTSLPKPSESRQQKADRVRREGKAALEARARLKEMTGAR